MSELITRLVIYHRRKACVGYLSNYEVLDILQGAKSNKQHRKPHNQLATITYQTLRYLEDTPCKKHTPETITRFLKAVESFKLTKCEKLTLLNLCPSTALEIQLVRIFNSCTLQFFILNRQSSYMSCSMTFQVIEDSEERLSEEEVNSLLEVIQSHLTDDKTDDLETEETQ